MKLTECCKGEGVKERVKESESENESKDENEKNAK